MGVVDQAVEDGVGQGWVAQGVMPVGDGQLAGDHGGAGLIALVEDFEQVAAAFIVERRQAPVVEDEDLDLGQGRHPFKIAAIGAGEGEFLEQAG